MSDAQAPAATAALDAIDRGVPTFVPSHWPLEVGFGLLMAERRKRITQANATEALDVLMQLPVEMDTETAGRVGGITLALARQYGLTIYDAVRRVAPGSRQLCRRRRRAAHRGGRRGPRAPD